MHVVMFGDQHVESLGGAQVSMRLQRRFLEKAGHTVTIVAPRMHGPRGREVAARVAASGETSYVDLPSIPITPDREYSFTWPGRRTDRFTDAALAGRPPVDVVHVQADFWGAFIGHRFAARHDLPVVHTMHNRVDVGIEATAPAPGLVLRVLNAWQRRALAPVAAEGARMTDAPDPERSFARSRRADGWSYLRRFAARSRAVTAPSAHFARRLEAHGVVPGAGSAGGVDPTAPGVDVIWNGIDDDALDAALTAERPGSAGGAGQRPVFVWIGRMSPEKRLLPFLEAVAESGVDAEVIVVGGGGQLAAARRLVEKRRPVASVIFAGKLPYADSLRTIQRADAVVQTSIGFETQGMTIFEAASLGTPSVVSDPDLARELGSGLWQVAEDADAAAAVTTLAAALRRAAADIAAGTAPVPDPSVRERFRQSSRTAAMVEVYERVRR